LTPAVLSSDAPVTAPPPREVTLTVGGEARTYKVSDIAAQGATQGPGVPANAALGGLHAARRTPTKDEVAAINARLAAVERKLDGAVTIAQAAPPAGAAGTN